MLERLTSREFLVGIGLFALVILNFERGYGLSEEMVGAIITGLIGAAAWRLAKKNGGDF
uniref:Holin n=1 Tax=viral metagenome TaxID=1070528 RepID=A0A6H1ZL24_9ZZZZ